MAKVSAVRKVGSQYVAVDSRGNNIGSAGALNLFGERATLGAGSSLHLGQAKDLRVEPDMHRAGVLFVGDEA